MPFTPFHLGPGLGIGVPLRKYIHTTTFILANILVDIESFIVLILRLNYPLHGYLHTFLFAFFLGLLLGGIMFMLEKIFKPFFTFFFLESPKKDLNLKAFLLAGISGTLLHVLLDSPLYTEIYPLFPLKINPLYNPSLSIEIYGFCILMGLFGILYYSVLLVYSFYKKFKNEKDNIT